MADVPARPMGDRIIQLTNDYEREVFNGDVGFMLNLDTWMLMSGLRQMMLVNSSLLTLYPATD
ncbi:hypothetical protein H6G81_19190 [Scytonema hofmannii FACHB-248]|uniref:Uncharacterized protein n=1 Tax=Scytonema hofmannii FACHB-248 TaxID=1842502 RepID=A0ABR8GV21_9CYAN|nr:MULTISPECIES: hypothetical protein [Nostocales]MBD2606598.1 hypothetical protein [Scytonema hofmannii FACHB-248]